MPRHFLIFSNLAHLAFILNDSNFEARNLIVSVSMVSNYCLVIVSINQQFLPAGIVHHQTMTTAPYL